MKQIPWVATIFVVCAFHTFAADNSMSLAGKWRFELDRADIGISGHWFDRTLPDKITLPGSLPAQGIGDDITTNTPWTGGILDRSWFTKPQYAQYRQPPNVKVPFWLQPDKYYKGVAWYQHDFEVPKSWQGRRVVLSLKRPHWETSVWLDGHLVGTNDSLATPHEYDFGQLKSGKHTLTIRVDNGMIIDIGENSHAISDHTQGNWNGIVGKIELRALPLVWLDDVQVYPNLKNKSIHVHAVFHNASGEIVKGKISYSIRSPIGASSVLPVSESFDTDATNEILNKEFYLGSDAKEWDEFSPALYKLRIITQSTIDGKVYDDNLETAFGLREISTDGTQFLVNGRKTFFRGTLECCVFPKTGHPPMDINDWLRILRVAKSYGLNLIRFHSYCPPEVAFEAADQLGIYFQIETCWANQSTTIGDGKPVDAWVYRETERILKAYGNHPSFVLMPYGNEPGGKNTEAYLAKYVAHFKALDSRRLWTSGSGWPQIPENQFDITPDPRIQHWGEGVKSRINAKPPETTTDYHDYIEKRSVPVISHEIGEWCVYPNFAEIPEYTGYLKPKNFDIFRDTLDAHGMGNLAHQFLLASGKLQTLCYKDDIESALRTPGMGGFELLGLNDFPGQGTALVGVLDPFWNEKGYVTAKEFSCFCNDVVPLARLKKRVFTTDESLEADLEIANFGPIPIENAVTEWKLVDSAGNIFAHGELPAKTIPVNNGIALGHVSVDLEKAPAPRKYKLLIGIAGTKFQNDWDIWVYPSQLPVEPSDILVTSKFDDAAQRCLQNGGKVLLTILVQEVRNYETDPVKLGFSSIFWNTAWTGRQAPTTLGILCDPKDPALAEFPTDYYSNWQWWYLIHRAGALRLDLLPKETKPIVRVIDDWVTAHPLALIIQGNIGKGKIVVCGFDLTHNANDPVSRQMRVSLLDYMNSKKFTPNSKFTIDQIDSLISPPKKIKVKSIKADSEQIGYEAANAIDGNPKTIWHTRWSGGAKPYPHELTVDFKQPMELCGVTILPRQDGNRHGWIKDYACYISDDGTNWGEPVAKGTFAQNSELKTILFKQMESTLFVRFVALSGFDSDPYASVAEFSILDSKHKPVGWQNSGSDPSGAKVPAQVRGSIFKPGKSGTIPITVDGRSGGLIFDGVGAVSSGGSSRLLIDYPEPERSQILDYLFKPDYGAALQILKVEIGADTDATCGSEPSHEAEQGKINRHLGYEWWLMKEARMRNPDIKFEALAWGAPGWIGKFWSDNNIDYTISWLDCAKQNGFTIDYLGGGNERGYNADYYIKLRKALDKNGYSTVKLIATEDHTPPNYWAVATEMKTNAAFAAAVNILGEHDICVWRTPQYHCHVSADALGMGKPLWDSENSTQDYLVGQDPLARVMTRHYLDGGVTGNINWALLSSMYGSFPCAGTGLILADRPWSGYYDIGKSIWVDAHTTQFTQPGWRYLDGACGYTSGGASFVTMCQPDGNNYTMVIETLDLTKPETLIINTTGGISSGEVQFWSTDMLSTNPADVFQHLGAITPDDRHYQVTIYPGHIYTLSTTSGQQKGDAHSSANPGAIMSLPYAENFETARPEGWPAKYFSDVHGRFEISPCPGGRSGHCYRQVITQEPILWHGATMPPTTILGDPRWWGDYEVSADALLEQPGYVELLGRIESQQHSAAGYHLQITDAGLWKLYTEDVAGKDRTLATGTNAPFGVNHWHRLALHFVGNEIIASDDGNILAKVHDESHNTGQIGLRVSRWQNGDFDNVQIDKTAPWPDFIPHSEMTATASTEHAMNDHGQIHSAQNAIDDRVETTWRSEYSPLAPLPQSITLDLGRSRNIQALTCKPSLTGKRDGGGHFITDYNIYLSSDGKHFKKVASGKWEPTITTKQASWSPQSARYVRLEANASSSRSGVAVSEINILAKPM